LQQLQTLISLLTKQKINQIEILTEDVKLSEKSRSLYDGVLSGEFLSDDDAALSLYGSTKQNPAYRKLKYRLKQRLINTVFFIDSQKYSRSAYEKALTQAYKNWAASKIIQRKGLNSLHVQISEVVLKQTLNFHIIELSLLISQEIIQISGFIQ